MEIAALEDLLREAEEHHGGYEASAPEHHSSAWYAAYISSRRNGHAPERASTDAGLYTEYVVPDKRTARRDIHAPSPRV